MKLRKDIFIPWRSGLYLTSEGMEPVTTFVFETVFFTNFFAASVLEGLLITFRVKRRSNITRDINFIYPIIKLLLSISKGNWYTKGMKNKKLIFAFFIGTIILISLILFVYIRYQDYQKRTMQVSQVAPTPEVIEDMVTWTDQSGFTVQYPKSLTLNPHDEDENNYAHLEFTSATFSGSLIVWAKDTNAVDIDDYAKKSKNIGYIDSTMGGEPAKKLLQNDSTPKIIISSIKDGYLYQIEADLKDNFWNKTFDKISSSFKFETNGLKKEENNVPVSSNEESSGGDSGGDEEIIE